MAQLVPLAPAPGRAEFVAEKTENSELSPYPDGKLPSFNQLVEFIQPKQPGYPTPAPLAHGSRAGSPYAVYKPAHYPVYLAGPTYLPYTAVGPATQRRRGGRKRKANAICKQCLSVQTPEWRRGPQGSRTLCNACGLFYLKLVKKFGDSDSARVFAYKRRHNEVLDRVVPDLYEKNRIIQVEIKIEQESRKSQEISHSPQNSPLVFAPSGL